MKKIILASVVAVVAVSGAHASASAICSGNSASVVSVSADTANAGTFVRTGFNPKCSANVHLYGDDGQTYYRVGAASTKGKNAFGGSSTGGAVAPMVTCAASGCTASDASNASASASST